MNGFQNKGRDRVAHSAGTGRLTGRADSGRVARLNPARAAGALLPVLTAILAASLAGQAQAQTEEWSASITTGSLSTLIGVWPDRSPAVGSMTDRDFDYDGTTYTFSHIRVSSGGGLQINMTAAFSQTALDNLTFQTGSSSFALSDATTSDNRAMNWNSAGLSWSSGQTIAVKMVSGGTTLSTDATLSGLDLTDNTSAGITLTPTFVSATTSYTAMVANSIDEITVEPASDNNATFAYLDDSDMALTDADTNKVGFQVDLSEGANTIKVKVTAEDRAATDTYTVVVTRAAMTIPPPSGTALVSNLVQTSGGIGSLNSYDQAQAFTTGDTFGGYALTSVEIQTTGTPTLNALTVSIRSDSSGSPDASLGTLMNSAAVASDGIATFTASGAGIDLERETTYFVMVDVSASDPSGNIQNTASDAEDPGKAANWSIGDTSLYRNKGSNGSWTSFADSKKIRVNGAAKAGVGSTDADLTGLALKDAADDSTVTLSPPFATATKAYTADVANDVAAVTVEPALSDSNATVAYLDASDTVLTDADTNTTGFQTALLVGETTIKVKVTAEDDLTTETYTVVVTRTAATGTTVVTIAADAPTAIYNEIGASFTVTRTGATTNPLDVVVALTQTRLFLDAGDLLKTVTIAAGSSSKTLSFSAGDLLLPASETRESGTLTATVQAGTGYNPGTTATASVDVVVALTVSFDELSYRVDEGVGMLQVMLVARTGVGAPAPASAWFSVSSAELNPPEAISSEDYGSLSVTVQIPASAYVADGNVFRAEVPVEVEILDDARDEPDERFHLQLQITPGLLRRYSNFTDADGVVCRNPICGMPITIEDNDAPPTVTLVLSPDSITENGGLSQITATLDHPSSEQTSIDISATAVPPLAVADDFFMPPSRRLSIPIGETQSVSTGHVVVLAIDNYVYSGNKSVTISGTASNDMGIVQPQAQTLTIEDDESGPATDATLSGLALKIAEDDSTIALSPGFAPGTTSYTAIVGVGVDTITVEPTENDSNATVAYLDGSDTALTDTDVYKARFQAALAEGANTIKVKVTAADRSTIQTYTVTVTRATAATDADLTGLALKNAADDSAVTLSPGFATATKSYTALVANNVLSITVESAKSDSNAAVAYLDFADAARVDADPIKPGFQVALGEGPNTINVQVTAADGHTTDTYTVVVTRESNTDATGQPAIAGAAQVGRTLTAELGTIADIDGLPGTFPDDYDFQWVRVDADGVSNETEIFVATSSTYTPVAADLGKKVKVKVSFTADDGSVVEGPLPSDATAPVVPDAASCGGSAVWCSTLTVEHGTPDVDGEFQVGLATNLRTPPESFGSLVGATFTHLDTSYTVTQIFADFSNLYFATSPNLPDDGAGLTLHIQRLSGALELKLNDRDSYDISAALPTGTKVWSFASVLATGSANPPLLRGFANPNGDYRQETDEGTLLAVSLFHENRDAEGTPTISGTAQVGETLTAGMGDIADADGLPGTFPDDYTFQWVRRDGGTDSPITGATASTYTPVAADVGKTVKVTVGFTDDAGTGEDQTSNAFPSSGTITAGTLPELSFASTNITVNENAGTATLTVELDPASTGTVTVDYATSDETAEAGEDYTAASGTLTFAASETSKTITVPILNDTDYDPTERFRVTLSNASGATLPTSPWAQVNITNNDAVPTASIANVTVGEGAGTMTLTLELDRLSNRDIFYNTLTSGVSGTATVTNDYVGFITRPFTVPKGAMSATFDITLVDDNLDETDETIVIVWIEGSGGNATPASITVTGTITDDDTANVTVSKTMVTVTEQDTSGDSYTVVLDSQPTANVVVTVAGHSGTDVLPAPTTLTFTSMNWETAQTVTVTAVNDADTTNDTVSLTHSAASTDTDYNGITIDGVTVTVADNDTAKVTGVVLTPGDGELAVAWAPLANATGYEVQWKSGGQSYNNSGRQATISSGSTASHTIPSLTNGTTYTVRMRATRTGANAGPYSDEAMDAPEAAGVTVSETALTVTEQDTTGDSYTVVLDSQPTANVVVTVAGHSGTDVLPAPTTLTFTSMNWETAQTVTVTAVNDADTTNDTVSLTHSAASTDTDYNGITIAGVTVTVEDNDTAKVTGLMLTPGDEELAVAWAPVPNATGYEVQWKSGGQGYNTSDRQATVASGSTTSHTISSLTNGTTYTVRVRATRTGANDGPYSDEEMDAPEAAGVTVSTTALTVTEEDTSGDSYTVVLDSQPTANVVVTVAGHSGTDVLPAPTTLTFTTVNWDTAQTVTVKGVNDTDIVDDTVNLTHTVTSTDTDYDGITIDGVTVTVADNDTAKVTGVVLTPGDGELAVAWAPLANATGYEVQWKSGGQSYNTSSRQATISSGSTASHTISSLTNGTTYTVRVRATRTGANAGPYSDVAMDAPQAAGVTVSKTALTVTEQDTTGDTYTIVLDSEPAASVTVTVAGHASTSVNPTPTSLTFTTMNWDTAQTVTVKAVNDANTVDETVSLTHAATSTDTDYDGITIAGVTVMVEDNDTAQVTGVVLTPGDGELAVEWVPLANATGYEVQWKSGGQGYNTSDRQATVASGSTASHTLPDLANDTEYTVRVRATRTGANDGPYSDEEMDAPEAAGVTVSTTALTVTEEDTSGDSYTVVLDSQPTANVVVTVAGHSGTDVLPAPTTLTFTTVNWDTAQTVTVKGVNDTDIVDDTVNLTHTVTSTDTDYDGITIDGVTVTVADNDTAKVTGVVLTPGDGELAVAWAPLANATGYEVQWKSGGQSYNNSGRQATISSGSTASHTIPSLTNGTTYTVRMRATRTGANNGPYSDEAMDAPQAAGVTVSETVLTVTEEDSTGDTYTVVLNSQPTVSVTIQVAGHASTSVNPTPTSLTFTTMNWDTAQTVTVKAVNDTNTVDETVSLTHAATSTDTDYDGITIDGVTVMVEDNDTAQVTGVVLTPGDGELAVEWAPLANATGYEVQWKSGGQSYNNSGRQATISSGSTASHTIPSLTNGTTYTVRMRATRTGANAGPYSDEAMDAPEAAGVTVSETALTVSEADTTGDSYTVVLDSEPAASVTVTVAGHASTSVNPTPTSLTFTTMNWDTAQTVTVKAVNDTNTVDETVSLTHAATSTDTDYDGITIAGVTVMVEDNDTAQVTGVVLTPGDGELAVAWVPLANATGYEVQWKSGGQSYNNSGRQATISLGSTASHTIPSLTNGTTYTVRMRATRTGANAGPYSDEAMDAPEAAGVTVSETALTVSEADTTGDSYTVVLDSEPAANVVVTVAGHASTDVLPAPTTLTFTSMNWDTAQTVTVKAVNDANTVDETVSLTHAATSTDTDYDGITIAGVTVMVEDNDTAQVTGVVLTPGDGELAVAWVPLANATGYEVQWKSGGQSYNNSGRQATISLGSTASHTIPSLTNGTTYTVRVRATRTGANAGPYSDEAMDAPEAAGVTVSKTALTVSEADTTGDSYTIVLDSEPAANVVVTVAGHSGTDVLPTPTTLTFTPINWETVQTVTVTAVNDADTTNDTVSLTHSAASTDTDYDGITIVGVTVTVEDNDTAKVTGLMLTPGDEELVVAWAPVPNATGYEVQWKSGGQSYNTSDRQATVASGSTASHTIPSLTNGTTYTVRVRATRTGANAGPYSDEAMDAPEAAGVTVSKTALTVSEADTTGDSYTIVLDSEPAANVVVTVAGHSGTDVLPTPTTLTFTPINWETVQTVTVTAVNDADTTNDTVSLTHSAASTDTDYDGITIVGVTVTVEDNDTAKVTGLMLTPGDEELVVAWAPVPNATGYEVQWKSGGQSYNTSDRQATVASGSTASHTISSLTNGTTYTVRVRATRTGANPGAYSDEAMDAPEAAAVPPVTLSIADASAFENAGHLLFDVTLSRSLPNTVKVDFETISGGTATEGVDYQARRTYTHVIPGRETTVQMGFALIEDTDNDAGETVKVRLSNARVVDAYGNVKMVLNITNAEATGTITAPATTTTNVPGLTIGIQDATGDEVDGWLDFRVRLSRKSDDLVCYDFETISGGTAEEGTDYLKIPKASYWMHIGKRVDTLLVRIIDDSVNDNGETVKVKISNARLCDDASQTVSITRDEATGTIRNTDPMPQAWLARFGRTAADHVVQAVEDRWQGEPRASHLTLGGRQAGDLFGWTGLAGPGDREKTENRDDPVGTDPSSMGWLAPSGGTGAGIGATVPGMTLGLGDMNTAPGGTGGVEREAGKTLSGRAAQGALLRALGLPDPRTVPDLRTLLMGSSFFYSAALDEDGQNRSSGRTRSPGWFGEWSAWGRTASSRFSGADGNLALDGEVATAMLGFDSRWDRWLAGVVVSFSEGQGAYTHPTASGGAVASTMTGLNPYARFELNERTSVWGVLGYGAGDLSLTPARSDTALGTDLTNAMAAFGGRTALSVRTGEAGRFELALRSDARLTNTVSESIEGLVGAAGRTARVRLMLEGSGSMRLATGGVLKPKLEAGLRYDTGDAETGAGLEVGGGLGYATGRLSVEVNARGLLAHRDTEYEEWGFSGSIAYTPSADGRGLSMRLGSAWGATQSGVQSLWSRQDASGLVRNAAFEAAQRYQVELRYGLDGKTGRARWEPFVGVESGEGASRALRLGVKLTSGRRLDAGLELGQRQGRPGADPEQAVQLRGALRW